MTEEWKEWSIRIKLHVSSPQFKNSSDLVKFLEEVLTSFEGTEYKTSQCQVKAMEEPRISL